MCPYCSISPNVSVAICHCSAEEVCSTALPIVPWIRSSIPWTGRASSTRLAPKVFEVLCYLIAHRDRVVSKQELCEQVWEGLAISDATLESCLRAVRLTVGDSGQAQRIIQTQRGYGYRFVADLALLPEDTSPRLPPLPTLAPPPVVPDVRPCAACHYTNPAAATFCAACGTRLRHPVPTVARISSCRRRSARPVGNRAASRLLQGLLPQWPQFPSCLRPS